MAQRRHQQHAERDTSSSNSSNVTYAGWVFKEGSLVKSWKKRFLVVKYAELAYYKDMEQENNKAQLLGAMTVARIEKLPDITNGLLLTSIEGRQLKLFTDSQRECDKCFHAVAKYARKQRGTNTGDRTPSNGQSTPSGGGRASHDGHESHRSHVGWLEKEGQHFKTWKRRYFVLEDNVLSYSSQIGGASLGKARVLAARRELTRPNTLVVMLDGGRELKIGGQSESEIHEWHKALRRGIAKHGGHRSPSTTPSQSPASAIHNRGHGVRPPADEAYAQPPPAYSDHVAGVYTTGSNAAAAPYSPLFGAAPSDDDDGSSTPHFSDEQQRQMAMRQHRGGDIAASFRRHIILDATPAAPDATSTSFIEVHDAETPAGAAAGKAATKPWSPKAPGANTILTMRLEDKLLLEELEVERQEELAKQQALNAGSGDARTALTAQTKKMQQQEDEAKAKAAACGPCCCLVM